MADLLIAFSAAATFAVLLWNPAPMKVFPCKIREHTIFSLAKGGRGLNKRYYMQLQYFLKNNVGFKDLVVTYMYEGLLNFSTTY